MNKKEIEKRYNNLLKKIETNDYYDIDLNNRVNCYVCDPCGSITKIRDADPGVTPFYYTCDSCGNPLAKSSFYNDVAPDMEPQHEWYRPSLSETLKFRKKTDVLDHILSGGLLIRKIRSDEKTKKNKTGIKQ